LPLLYGLLRPADSPLELPAAIWQNSTSPLPLLSTRSAVAIATTISAFAKAIQPDRLILQLQPRARVEANTERIVETLSDLVAFPSIVTSNPKDAGPGERDCQL
jgi:hypothetical protein